MTATPLTFTVEDVRGWVKAHPEHVFGLYGGVYQKPDCPAREYLFATYPGQRVVYYSTYGVVGDQKIKAADPEAMRRMTRKYDNLFIKDDHISFKKDLTFTGAELYSLLWPDEESA